MSEQAASPQKPSAKAKALSARLSAVQALYQVSQNKQSIRTVYDEYIRYRSHMEVDGEALVPPDGALLKKILYGVEERQPELEAVVDANLKRDATDRVIEPLLRSILICGAYELLIRETDPPIVINDYLNVAHTFYGRGEVALINGVLDAISAIFQ
jgi:N utilization substance protein B